MIVIGLTQIEVDDPDGRPSMMVRKTSPLPEVTCTIL